MERISRKVKQGVVDVDYEDSALVVHYDMETVELDSRGGVVDIIERKSEQRRIKIKSLSPDKNMAQLAADIIEKCKYIHPSRIEEIEQLLIKLRKHHLSQQSNPGVQDNNMGNKVGNNSSYPDEESDQINKKKTRSDTRGRVNSKDGPMESSSSNSRRNKEKPNYLDNLPPADMNALDDYLEMLYQVSGKSEREKEEGLKLQEKGTAMILKLCRDVINLEQLIQNSTVMGAITRVLQEEYKKSIDLTFTIVRIFLAFSNFAEMHGLMANYRIGVLTMKVIEFEIKRSEVRENEKIEREKDYQQDLQKFKQENPNDYPQYLEKQRRLMEKEKLHDLVFTKKQNKLLFVCFYILLNLADDINTEKKMMKKDLSNMMLAMLSRANEDLLVLVITFLKKLSMFEENIILFKEQKLIDSLLKCILCNSQTVVLIALRLLFNLSFDKDLRDQMLKTGYIPKLILLLKVPVLRAKTLKLLYHLSVDDRCKSMITYTDGISILMGMTINFPQDILAKELAALMINLSYHPRNVELMLQNKGLNLLMNRFYEKHDVFIIKIIRNISLFTFRIQEGLEQPENQYTYRGLWSPHVKTLLEILFEEQSQDLCIEIIGTLANFTVFDLPSTLPWAKLLKDYNFMSYFTKALVPGMTQDDFILEIIMLIASMATDINACSVLATGNLIPSLYSLFQDKQSDPEIVLQLLNCFYKLLHVPTSREAVMYSTRIFADIIECLTHRQPAIRSMAEQMSDIVLEYDRKDSGELGALAKSILKKRFENYNRVWLQAVMNSSQSMGSELLHHQSSGDISVVNNQQGNNYANYYLQDELVHGGAGILVDDDLIPSGKLTSASHKYANSGPNSFSSNGPYSNSMQQSLNYSMDTKLNEEDDDYQTNWNGYK